MVDRKQILLLEADSDMIPAAKEDVLGGT